MKIDWLKPLVGRPGPFATVHLDATPSAEAGDRDVANRWRGARRALERQGAPAAVLDALEGAVLRPTREGGERGRVLIADADGLLVDRVLRRAPTAPTAVWLPVPALLQAALAADEAVDALCVAVDRAGADFWSCDAEGHVLGERTTYTAPHDEVSKTSSPGTKRATIESRAEDTWERNAAAVAAEVDRRVAERRPEVVLLTGDVRAVKSVRSDLAQPTAVRTVEVPGGGRGGAGVHADAFASAVEDALDSFRERRREVTLAEFRQDQGREEGAVTSVDDVVAVLARGQVKELVLSEQIVTDAAPVLASTGEGEPLALDGLLGGRRLWIGPDPMHVGRTREDLESLGAGAPLEELPATSALLRAAIAQDAGLTFAPEGSVELVDGVGATLRWHDGSTPREVAATMSGDGARLAPMPR